MEYFQGPTEAEQEWLKKNEAIDFGIKGEPIAKELFKIVQKCEVTQLGLVIKNNFPFLGASPDGIIQCEKWEGIGILEIKCPMKGKDLKGVPFLIDDKVLNPNHDYYTQIQLQAWACNSDYAKLFLYSGVDFLTIDVPIAREEA